jgi:pilus assembly protein CpaE
MGRAEMKRLDAVDDGAAPAGAAPSAHPVLAVEPDQRRRTQMTIELAGIVPSPFADADELAGALGATDAAVVVLGPSFATPEGFAAARTLTRRFPSAGFVLVAEAIDTPLLQEALRAGVRDVVAIGAGERLVRQAIENVSDAVAAAANRFAVTEVAAEGRVLVSFSTKGGVGKSVVSTNLAVALALDHPGRVVLVDADLQFGDVGVLLGLPPERSVLEAAGAIDTADTTLLERLLATHEASGLRVLCAPADPGAGDSVSAGAMVEIVRLLRKMFDFVVIDMAPHFNDVVLALLEEADEVLLVASMDVPSVKNLRVGIQTLDLLSIAGPKLRLVLNRANARVNLDVSDVEKALGVDAEFRVPSDIAVPQAVNRGVPIVLDRPRSPAALALRELARAVDGSAPTDVVQSETKKGFLAWRRGA